MLYVYIGCLTFGVLYAVMASIFSGHGFDHGNGDIQGDLSHGGVPSGSMQAGHISDAGHIDHSSDGPETPSPFNPLVMASAVATFGGVGLIGKAGFGMGDAASSAVALGFAGAIGAAIFFGIVKFMYGSQSNSSFSLSDLPGCEAEVITPVPDKGLGEIAYVINGVRYSLPARSESSEKIGKGAAVKIKEIQGNVAVVYPKLTIDDYKFDD